MVSIVIPHKGRDSILIWQLKELQRQSFADFDVTVVLDEEEPNPDTSGGPWYEMKPVHSELHTALNEINLPVDVIFSGGGGPAAARNAGVRHAFYDIVLMLGSDCIPDVNLVAEHARQHMCASVDTVQGYTPWHPDVITPFYGFLEATGLQAAWGALKNDDGSWKTDVTPAFCLTTNWSARRQLLLNEPFDEVFTGAAWEDVELGYRLARRGDIKGVFTANAVNYHYHRYDLLSFLSRCRMEGYHRLTLCKKHPELSWSYVNPFELREVLDAEPAAVIKWATELEGIDIRRKTEETQSLIDAQYRRYLEACKIFSVHGVLDRIKDEHPAMKAVQHVHRPEQIVQIIGGVAAIESGHRSYAQHCAAWFIGDVPGDWSAHSFAGEVALECGNKEEAISYFRASSTINGGAEWPKLRLDELL